MKLGEIWRESPPRPWATGLMDSHWTPASPSWRCRTRAFDLFDRFSRLIRESTSEYLTSVACSTLFIGRSDRIPVFSETRSCSPTRRSPFSPPAGQVAEQVEKNKYSQGFVLDRPRLDLGEIDPASGEGLKHLVTARPGLSLAENTSEVLSPPLGGCSFAIATKRVMLLLRSSMLLAMLDNW